MSDMVGTVLSQKPRRLQRFRNESSFARSDAEQRPDHAGRQYVILERMVARNTSWSDSVENSLPDHVKVCSTLKVFKKNIKKHMNLLCISD